MFGFDSHVSRIKAMLLRAVSADLILQENELAERIEEQAAELEASGKPELANRLRALAHSDLKQLEPPRRGRPRKVEGGEL